MLNDVVPFLITAIISFVIGFVVRGFLGLKIRIKNEVIFAYIIGYSWFFWTFIISPFTEISSPSTTVDIISGGAIGVIMGEKFFDYVAGALTQFKK